MSKLRKVLFISHDSYRTGAPILLLHFIKNLKLQFPKQEVFIILKWKGQLQKDFEALGRTYILENEPPSLFERILFRLVPGDFRIRLMNRKSRKIFDSLKSIGIGTIFSNTVTNGELYDDLKAVCDNIVTYAHELENSIIQFTDAASFDKVIRESTQLIFPCMTVRDFYIHKYHVPAEKTRVLPYYIPETKPTVNREEVLLKLDIPADNKIVLGMGAPDWRKGIDLFIQACKLYFTNHPNNKTRFLWVGFIQTSGPAYSKLIYDIKKLGIEDKIMLLENIPDAINYINAADIFLLSSREDPYPVVAIEAAMLAKPVIYFKDSGGISELLPEQSGIQYGDASHCAEEVHRLLNCEKERTDIGNLAREKYLQMHATNERIEDLYSIVQGGKN